MATQKQWDIFEASILLDNYISFLNGKLTRKEAIEVTSKELRSIAENRGMNIDDVFRNVNGITFQMHSIESAYKGYTVMKPSSRLFEEIVNIYKTDAKKYEEILMEARSMIPHTTNNSDKYIAWLSGKVSPAQLSELYMVYKTIDEFLMKTKVLNKSILNETDIDKIKGAQRTIEQNRLFKFQHKRDMSKISSAMKWYNTFIREQLSAISEVASNDNIDEKPTPQKGVELSDIRNEQDRHLAVKYPLIYKKIYSSLKGSAEIVGNRGVTVTAIYENIKRIARCETIKEILDSVSWSYCDGAKYHFSDSIIEKPLVYNYVVSDSEDDSDATQKEVMQNASNDKSEIRIIDLSNIGDLSYTRPIYSSYFGEDLGDVSSWTQLYLSFFKKLYEDYEYKIPVNKSFTVLNGRMDLCSKQFLAYMTAPKEIAIGVFLETNLSSTDILRKIKSLLEICLVDENNLIIKYEKKSSDKVDSNNAHTIRRTKNSSESDMFFSWLAESQGLAEPTCRSYVSAVNGAETFARDNNFTNTELYTDNTSVAQATIRELFNNESFIDLDNRQHHRFKAGLNKLLIYLNNSEIVDGSTSNNTNLEPFKSILIEKFPRGYRISSPLELRKFKRFWEESYGAVLESSDDEIKKNITMCGVIHEEKLYMPQTMLDEDTRMSLFSYINKSFQSGKQLIYYEAIFKDFSNAFLDHCMYNAEMLKAYLTYMNDSTYFIGRNYISKDRNVRVDPYQEVKRCLEAKSAPMEYDEIFDELSHIPQQKIKTILAQNDEFISNGRSVYFHISVAELTEEDLENISSIIQSSIDDKSFISGNELTDSIGKKYPHIIEQNPLLSDKGLRDAIGYKLKGKFSFKGNIISKKGQSLSMMDVFANFCKHRSSFTLNELKILKQELDTTIYFEAVYENSLRISKEQFVSKNNAAFRPAETDEAIDRFCIGDYMAIGKIQQFGTFPDAGFHWNSFLLESYVAMYSTNYKLVHSNYNEGVCVGGIVKKISDIDTLDELIVDALAANGLPLQKETSLQYLCDEGYLARRSYSGLEQLLIKAKELRNQRGL